ncbi:LysR substrate-binding domain-containing protein [Alicycliphilus denitrificans]|uniref:LysR substrate-binding domain-containing protein n=1 Tax=Alicycliphilus denitrificans TaxID=179636 RepID=UPI0023789ACF|nr:LysR substrate-binding domain-containing protein [Alicycliphilus denitrificans]
MPRAAPSSWSRRATPSSTTTRAYCAPALQGVGLVKHLDLCVRQHLASGALVRVLQPWCAPFPGFFLYVPSRAQMPAKIRALMDFLVEKRAALQ